MTADQTQWSVTVDTQTPSAKLSVTVTLNGVRKPAAPLSVKGVCYSPCPINGSNGFAPALGDWFWDSFSGPGFSVTGWEALWKRDIPNIRALGANTIRVYNIMSRQLNSDGTFPVPWNSHHLFTHTSFLDECWNGGLSPLYVLVGVALPQAMFWLDIHKQTPQSEIDFWTNVLGETAKQVAGHPAVMGFIIQNEMDSAVVTYPNQGNTNTAAVNFWWSQVEAMAKIAKQAAPGKLVGMAVHDDPNICGKASQWMAQAPSMDFWGVNTYQTLTFQPVFDQTTSGPGYSGLPAAATKGVILTEYGIPATGHKNPSDPSTIYADSTTEANAAAVLDAVIPQAYGNPPPPPQPAYKAALSLGLTYFEYCDEWWNQGGAPNIWTWYGGAHNSGFPNGFWDQDGFGLYSVKRGGTLANNAPIWVQNGPNGGPNTPIDVHTARQGTVASVKKAFK